MDCWTINSDPRPSLWLLSTCFNAYTSMCCIHSKGTCIIPGGSVNQWAWSMKKCAPEIQTSRKIQEECKTAMNTNSSLSIVYSWLSWEMMKQESILSKYNTPLSFRHHFEPCRIALVSSKICVLILQLHLLLQAPVSRVHRKCYSNDWQIITESGIPFSSIYCVRHSDLKNKRYWFNCWIIYICNQQLQIAWHLQRQ